MTVCSSIKNLKVLTPSANYEILFSDLNNLKKHFEKNFNYKEILIVSNETIASIYLKDWKDFFEQNCLNFKIILLKDGEEYKNFDSLNKIFTTLLVNNFTRKSLLVALGGGVIGDITGFASSSYQRGVDFIQIPTTLLSCVDSSVGGKTAINHSLGKNMIGAFYQPKAVFMNLKVLETLPFREYISGLAEVIKYGCILDYEFFIFLENNVDKILNKDINIINEIVYKCCEIKSNVVANDELEKTGYRALLNFGHTFGHAIEVVQKYKGFKHGEAVALGMCIASDVSVELGILDINYANKIKLLCKNLKLPINPNLNISVESIYDAMLLDKKNTNNCIRYILLNNIGEAIFYKNRVENNIILKVLKKYFK